MMLLALEFSALARGVALLERHETDGGWRTVASRRDLPSGRNIGPLALVEALLAEAKRAADSVQTIILGLGPGSYTGIRSAIALAQGWHLARGIEIYGVGTVECLALQAQRLGWFGTVTVGIDAQRNEFYLAEYQVGPDERSVVRPLHLGSLEELRAAALSPGLLIGPEVSKWAGSGRDVAPEAATLVDLVDFGVAPIAPEQLQPIYLRETTFVKAAAPRSL